MSEDKPRHQAPHLLDQPREDIAKALTAWLEEQGEPEFRGRQILEHVFSRRHVDPRDMANIPKKLREQLVESWLAPSVVQDVVQESADGTRKYRYRLHDGAPIEAVWIPSNDRATLCVSSQAGCPAKCSFCATGAGGFTRQLSAAEILGQWLDVLSEAPVTQVVFMGMGEPLLNFAPLTQALDLMTHAEAFAYSPRRITVSTVGIAPRMKELLDLFPQVRLALSLHSAVDRTRDRIVPFNKRYPLESLREVLMDLPDTARRVSLEYVVLKGFNDSEAEARALAEFAADTAAHVNLLPFHPFPGTDHEPVSPAHMERFKHWVEDRFAGAVTIRRSRGLDIAGACGQLAAGKLNPK